MPISACRPRWYVVQCKTREDSRALEHLVRQGFSCYRPTFYVERRRQGRKIETRGSLFPGYLFVQLDEVNDNWHPIRSTRGVVQLVRFNERPAPVRDEVIEGIRYRLAGPRIAEPYLNPGERVQITKGAFSQIEAIFLANDGDERVVLLLNILQQDQRLSFPSGSVSKTGA
jgi:transcriptional antiterminator RfaH